MCKKRQTTQCKCDIFDIMGFSGVEPSRSIPPSKPKHLPPRRIREGEEHKFSLNDNKKPSKLKRILDILFE